MFERARIKLTIWYTLIIFGVSAMFSFGVYSIMTAELARNMRVQAFRMMPRYQQDRLLNLHPELADLLLSTQGSLFDKRPPVDIIIDEPLFQEGKRRIALQLIWINTGIAMAAAVFSYFLSGKTLAPIAAVMEEQKRFVADASHELRTPLTSLKTEIEVALRDNKMKLADAKMLLVSNLEEVDKMQHLSNYLLSLSKYQSGSLHLPFSSISLSEIAEKVIKKHTAKAKLKHIELVSDLHIAQTKGNPLSIEELAAILIDNAIKYSNPDSKVTIKTYTKSKHATLEVQDSGIGIKESDIPYIFNRFYRADTSRCKTKIDGYGLGLAIAKSIVDLHGGNISVTSKVNKGSTFKVVI